MFSGGSLPIGVSLLSLRSLHAMDTSLKGTQAEVNRVHRFVTLNGSQQLVPCRSATAEICGKHECFVLSRRSLEGKCRMQSTLYRIAKDHQQSPNTKAKGKHSLSLLTPHFCLAVNAECMPSAQMLSFLC